VVGGAVVAADTERLAELTWWANCLGITGAPFDSYLTLRGLRTLDARVRVHQENAAAIAAELSRHPAIERVHYPGLADHPGHLLAAAQQDGFGSLLSFELAGGVAAVAAFVGGLECFSLAESLGGVESLVAHPASMTHAAMTPEARAAAGISDSLLRLSVGIESVEDLLDDLGRALQRAERAVRQAVAV
jgi:cystathionine gamma-synthase